MRYGIELLLLSRVLAPPQIVVEDAHQLLGGREGDDLAGVLEAALADEPMQDAGLETLDDPGEVRRFQDAREQSARSLRLDALGRHQERPPRRPYHEASWLSLC